MSQELKIHVVGSEDTVIGFGLVGINGTIVKNPEEAKQLLETFTKPRKYDLIIINTRLLQGLEQFIDDYRLNSENPILFDIPDETGIPIEHLLKKFVKKAFSM